MEISFNSKLEYFSELMTLVLNVSVNEIKVINKNNDIEKNKISNVSNTFFKFFDLKNEAHILLILLNQFLYQKGQLMTASLTINQ